MTRTDARAYPGLTAGAPSAESSAAAAAASVPDPGVATKGNSAGKMARAAGPGAGGRGRGPPVLATHVPRREPRVRLRALDDNGVPQLYLVRLGDDRETTALMPVTRLAPPGVQSCFSWSPDGSAIAFAHDGSVCVVRAPKGTRASQRRGGTSSARRGARGATRRRGSRGGASGRKRAAGERLARCAARTCLTCAA